MAGVLYKTANAATIPAARKARVIWTPTPAAPLPLPVRPPAEVAEGWAVIAAAELEAPATTDRVALEIEATAEEVAKAGGVLIEVMAEVEETEADARAEVELAAPVADKVKLPTAV